MSNGVLDCNDTGGGMHDGSVRKLEQRGTWTEYPASPLVFGNFIESGFGRQVDGMWAEMLFNRAFRVVPPYTSANDEWVGLDHEHINEDAPFWHSGYEEHDWTVFGDVSTQYSLGACTYKGSTSLLVTNQSEGTAAGVKQEGVYVKAGESYRFRLFSGRRGSLSQAGLNGFGSVVQSERTIAVKVSIGNDGTVFHVSTEAKVFEWEFTASSDGPVPCTIAFDSADTLIFAFASLMSVDTEGGWRRDVVDLLRQVNPGVVRFPGGCFVSFYDWEKTIGPRDERDPQPSQYWGGLEENDAGLDEFLDLAERAGFEPQICFTMMTSNPSKARRLVEYVNAPAEIGAGRQRMLNGRSEPYHVRLFEMDNEPDRKWTAEQYAHQCVRYAREMRLADPTIEFMMAAYTYDIGLLPMMLDIAGEDIDYVIERDGSPEFVACVLPILRDYNRRTGRNIRLVDTEWLPSCHSIEPFEDPAVPTDFHWHGEVTNDWHTVFSIQQLSWNYALNGAHRLLDYLSYGGEFALAIFNNMCNTWGQNVIEASKEKAWLSCMGEVFAFFSRHFKPCLAAEVDGCGDDGKLHALLVSCSQPEEGEPAADGLYAINHSSQVIETMLPTPKGVGDGHWTCVEALQGESHLARQDGNVSRIHAVDVPVDADGVVRMPPLSLAYFRWQAC